MAKRNGTTTDAYDLAHRIAFVKTFRALGYSRQLARYRWAQRVRGAAVPLQVRHAFDDVSAEMAKGGTG
jgi:hypothetical protein